MHWKWLDYRYTLQIILLEECIGNWENIIVIKYNWITELGYINANEIFMATVKLSTIKEIGKSEFEPFNCNESFVFTFFYHTKTGEINFDFNPTEIIFEILYRCTEIYQIVKIFCCSHWIFPLTWWWQVIRLFFSFEIFIICDSL